MAPEELIDPFAGPSPAAVDAAAGAAPGVTAGREAAATPNPTAGEPGADRAGPAPAKTTPWWRDESMPWAHKPTWRDIVCWILVGIMSVWTLAMIPASAVLVRRPFWASVIASDRLSWVAVGALSATSHRTATLLPGVWLITAASALKFNMAAVWAGRLWGQRILDQWSGKTARAKRTSERVKTLAQRYPAIAIAICYFPIMPFGLLIYGAIGAGGIRFKRYLALDFIGALIGSGLLMWAGFALGQPAVDLLLAYSRYAGWVALVITLALIAVIVQRRVHAPEREAKAEAKAHARAEKFQVQADAAAAEARHLQAVADAKAQAKAATTKARAARKQAQATLGGTAAAVRRLLSPIDKA